jgi:pimeloyl-ACP methyl ester carboxylesterase
MTSRESVSVDGLRIAYSRVGDGPLALLLHGGLADHREWEAQLALANELTLVAWDAPGCGGSDDPPAWFRMDDYAALLTAFVDAVGLGRPHVVGLSFGATLALALARHSPSLPRTLVLASPYAGWAGSLSPETVAERLESGLRALDRGPAALAEDFLETLFGPDVDPQVVARTSAMLMDVRTEGARTMLRAMAECDLREALGRVSTPTLVIHGTEDVRAPEPVAQAIHEAIPGSVLVALPGVGHQCTVEAPAEFNTTLRTFLRGANGG